jgi:hypothetical protein
MRLPLFTAESSLRSTAATARRAATQNKHAPGEVVPQAYQVVCTIDAENELHCGIHDFGRGISIPLF